MGKLRFDITITLDGYVAGPNQGVENPLGEGAEGIHDWAVGTRAFAEMHGREGGETGVNDDVLRESFANVGATLMGRNMFGGGPGPWGDDPWTGWWGDDPPFHTPVFVLTHHPRPSFTLADTTFHFVDATPEEAARQAKEAAGGKDVRIGGGVNTVRQFLEAGLVDTLHVAVAPLEIGQGERLWSSPGELDDRYHHEAVPSASGITHHLFWKR
jgi:dihydrofolate reductase